jgi:ribonuclease HI
MTFLMPKTGTEIANQFSMDCYFGSFQLPIKKDQQKVGVVIFHIPELGIRFKAPFDGIDEYHNDFAALMALLEFIDSNQQFLKSNTFQIYGDNKKLINQINQIEPLPVQFTGLLEKTIDYKKKYRFSLSWVSQERNTALDNLYD